MIDLTQVSTFGQSLWINAMRRAFIESGELRRMMDAGISGVTTSPATFAQVILGSADYDKQLQALVAAGKPIKKIYEALVADDIQRTADVLHVVYEQTDGMDGYVSLELDPQLAHDTVKLVAEARHLLAAVDRGNVMIEIPATPAGIEAFKQLLSDGLSVNVTHVFSLEVYQQVLEAYMAGVDIMLTRHSVYRFAPVSVVSVSLNRIDARVDAILRQRGQENLLGEAGRAVAKTLYSVFYRNFNSEKWSKLAQRGARVQRLLWTGTQPRDFRYTDTYYVNALIGPHTVQALSPATLAAFQDHGVLGNTLFAGLGMPGVHLQRLAALDIDMEGVAAALQVDVLLERQAAFKNLVHNVVRKRDLLEENWRYMRMQLGEWETAVSTTIDHLCQEKVACRIWSHDQDVWPRQKTDRTDHLGWLHLVETMQPHLDELEHMAREAQAAGYTQALVIGMGGPCITAALVNDIFRIASRPCLPIKILDTTDPRTLLRQAEQLDLAKTLFVIASKSGQTVETLFLFSYFYQRVVDALGADEAGAHFMAVTDPMTPLAKLAGQYRFRALFVNDPQTNGRFGALSYFGLVPAALAGVDLPRLLGQAAVKAANASGCNCAKNGDNAAVQLGAALGVLAQQGRDKVTFILSPPLAAFGDWVEHLLAVSTGKSGKGVVPIVGEAPVGPPAGYGDDRVFVYVRLEGDATYDQAAAALAKAGHPLITMNLHDVYDVGGLCFTWQMATAVLTHLLAVNPFAETAVDAAKQKAVQSGQEFKRIADLPSVNYAPLTADVLQGFLAQAEPGDYVALLAFVPKTAENDAALQTLRSQISRHTHLATTVAYGPRYLHSTGQLHKEGPASGLFVQLIALDNDGGAPIDAVIPALPVVEQTGSTFGVLTLAQAVKDAQALKAARRRVMTFPVSADVSADLQKIAL